jgi:phosphomannomutase/phosphoglucomutase
LIYGRAILAEKPGATIIGDVKCSSQLFDDLSQHGANAIMWKTGHSLIKGKLKETGGDLAGEMSGHIFFKHRYFGFDDALYSSARLLEIMSKHSGPLSSLLTGLRPMVSTPELRIDCPEAIKFQIAQQAQAAFKEFKVDTIDGVRITFDQGWGLVRASNTQPVLVMRFEAESSELLENYKKLVADRIVTIKASLSLRSAVLGAQSEHQNERLILSILELGVYLKRPAQYSTETIYMYFNKESGENGQRIP